MVFHYHSVLPGRNLVKWAMAGTMAGVLAGILLLQCSDRISSVRKPLVITAAADSTVLVNDTLRIKVSAQGANSEPVSYVWFTDNSTAADTSADSILAQVFTIADTGRRCVVVKAINRGGAVSAPDSLHVCVRWVRPAITLRFVNPIAVADTELCIAVPVDSCGTIQTFRWTIDSFAFMTKSDSVRWLFNDKVNAMHTIRLSAVDNNGFVSDTDSVKVLVLLRRPMVALTPHDTAVYSFTSLKFTASGSDSDGTVVRYSWMLDGRPVADLYDSLTESWGAGSVGAHFLTVAAVNADSLASLPDSAVITVMQGGPMVNSLHDTTIWSFDTLWIACQASDPNGTIVEYLWNYSGGSSWNDSTTTPVHAVMYSSSGQFSTIIGARDNHGLIGADTVITLVKKGGPVLTPLHDTTIWSFDTLWIACQASDPNGTIVEYLWNYSGGSSWNDSTTTPVHAVMYSSSGQFSTIIGARDNHGLIGADTVITLVKKGGPVLTPLHDTTISSLDTLHIACRTYDSNGTIVKYLWNLSGGAIWTDSTVAATHSMLYAGSAQVRAVVGARDNHGLFGADTFTVNYNMGPESLSVAMPKLFDTILVSQNSPVCSLSFGYGAVGTNLSAITYTVMWGASGDSLTAVYQGSNQSFQIGGIGPGAYSWKIIARDGFRHQVSKSGTVTVLREYLVAFVGHSIVAGIGGDLINGGFREGILDSIRAHLGPYERAKAVGPVTPPYMASTNIDDSCLALGGATGFEVWQSLSAIATQLTADAWVLMSGVNDNYAPVGLTYVIMMMDIMHTRNPNSRIYVLNGVVRPNATYNNSFVDGDYWLPSFNQGLADSIRARQSSTYAIFQVNADSALCPGDTFSPTLMPADSLHPNQAGYDTLAKSIYSEMKKSVPPAMP